MVRIAFEFRIPRWRPRLIFVVLGMHKSGTTLVSQMLHHSGVDMVEGADEGVSYDKGNKYERRSTLDLDVELLGHADYDDVLKSPPRPIVPTADQRERMRGIIAECDARHPDWGFKDPRCSLVYDLWAEELPDHKLVVVYRHPAEIWHRYMWTGYRRLYRNFTLAQAFLLSWYDHNIRIIEALRRTKMEFIVIRYRDLMTGDAAFERLCRFCGRDLDDRRRPELYRGRRRMDVYLKLADRIMKMRRGRSARDVMDALADLGD